MNIKALVEKKNELKSEYRSLLTTAETEKRNLNEAEEVREAELSAEIHDINTQIEAEEKRSAEEADKVEKINSEEEKREMENQITKEQEVRAIEQFIRKQDGEELRAVTATLAGSESNGGLTVPTQISSLIVEKLTEHAPIFARTKNFTPVNGFLEILKEGSISNAGFVGEMQEPTKKDFTLSKVKLDQKRVGTAIELTQHLINDSGIDIVGYATNVLSRRLGLTIDQSVLFGDKATQFEGIVRDELDTIEKINTSVEEAIAIEDLLDVYNALHPSYVPGAVWVMGRKTFNLIAKLKDGNGHFYLVRDVATSGSIYKLFGQPVLINDFMADPVGGQKAVIFCNFGEAYATMTKKGFNLQHISGDTTQAMRGSHLLLLDGYMDGKILNQEAAKLLVIKDVAGA